jgi:methylated-DNA-[protein]-cysteine S-methyltransferase
VGATRLAYDVEGWGTGELWAADGRLVWHELPRPRAEPAGPTLASSEGPPRASSHFEPSGEAVTRGKRERVGSVTLAELADRIGAYFAGDGVSFDDVELDLDWCTPFQRGVADVLRGIPRGQTVTYGELAALAGHPNAQRAAGTFCAGNRFGLVIPCHRVVAADGLGSYGSLGVGYKRRLLQLEGAL